jgi:hypothetical protein
MTLHYDTVTREMRSIAKVIFDTFDVDYYLAGGTALALQIGHRKSVDLDYFIAKEIDVKKLEQQIFTTFHANAVE